MTTLPRYTERERLVLRNRALAAFNAVVPPSTLPADAELSRAALALAFVKACRSLGEGWSASIDALSRAWESEKDVTSPNTTRRASSVENDGPTPPKGDHPMDPSNDGYYEAIGEEIDRHPIGGGARRG